MYESYWELSEPPFDNSPNPKFFYLSPEHEEALVRLVYTVRHRKGCGMLTGEYGCGKTTLSRALIQRLEAERYEIGLLTNPSWTPVDFLREVLYQLGVETDEKNKPELLHLLNDAFYRNYQAGRDSVVIVDEAQLIDDDAVFEELRLLLNFQTDERFLVTLLLIGSPELAVKVRRMKHLDQRITLRYHLNTLDYTHTANYIAHRRPDAAAARAAEAGRARAAGAASARARRGAGRERRAAPGRAAAVPRAGARGCTRGRAVPVGRSGAPDRARRRLARALRRPVLGGQQPGGAAGHRLPRVPPGARRGARDPHRYRPRLRAPAPRPARHRGSPHRRRALATARRRAAAARRALARGAGAVPLAPTARRRAASPLHAAPRGHRRGGVAAPRARARAGLPPGARRRGDPPRRQDPRPRRHVCGAHRPADLATARAPARGDPRHRAREARVLRIHARQGAALRGLGLSAGYARAPQHG